jgi:hypothetical protein
MKTNNLINQIQAYLSNGGLFNPELADHLAVRNLLMECREALAQPEQPKVRTGNCLRVGICASEGHKIQPQRTWVGLKDKEIEEIWKIAMFTDYGVGAELSNQPFVHYAKAIEAKLKERNS